MSPTTPPVHLVTRAEQIPPLLEALASADFLALDTEFFRERTYYPQLALLQVATNDAVWLIDPLSGIDLAPIWEQIVATKGAVVMHAGDQDLDLILSAAGRLPQQVFDTQIAAELLGIGAQLSYAALTEALLGVTLDKAETRSDWLARPLSEAQYNYAVQDVVQLQRLYPMLRDRLEQVGRLDWMSEEAERQLQPARFAPHDESRWKKVRGLQTLNRAGLAALKVLAAHREVMARERDLPRRWVWGDQALLDIAHAISKAITRLPRPVTAEDIIPLITSRKGPLSGNAPARLERLRALSAEIAETLNQPPADWPSLPRPPSLPPEQRELLKSAQKRLAGIASRESISPSRLATSAELKHHMANPDRPSRLTQGWRAQLLAPVLQDLDTASPSLKTTGGPSADDR
ncbi:hypothetical protein P8631_08895 [Guyparkeria sp. 1SP6A2]|nr:hypothetical protein [Guyparkeria sp. 1SP6A2]